MEAASRVRNTSRGERWRLSCLCLRLERLSYFLQDLKEQEFAARSLSCVLRDIAELLHEHLRVLIKRPLLFLGSEFEHPAQERVKRGFHLLGEGLVQQFCLPGKPVLGT